VYISGMEIIIQNSPDLQSRPTSVGIFYENHDLAGRELGLFYDFYNKELNHIAILDIKQNVIDLSVLCTDTNTIFLYKTLDFKKGVLDAFFSKNKDNKPFAFAHVVSVDGKKIIATPNWNQQPFFPIINGYEVYI
jgi:hypothetical protein